MTTATDHIAVQVLAHFHGLRDVMVIPMTCVRDRLEHAVTDIEIEAEHRSGRGIYRSMCGHKVMPGSLASPPGRSCSACLGVLASLRLQARLAKPGPTAGRRLRAAARRALGRGVPRAGGPRQADQTCRLAVGAALTLPPAGPQPCRRSGGPRERV